MNYLIYYETSQDYISQEAILACPDTSAMYDPPGINASPGSIIKESLVIDIFTFENRVPNVFAPMFPR